MLKKKQKKHLQKGAKKMYSPCPYICDNKNSLGHCNSTACVNPKHNTQNITLNRTLTDEEVEKALKERETE